MIDNRLIFSLDLAKQAGISWYYKDTFYTKEVCCTVEEQFDFIFWKFIKFQISNTIVLIEDFIYFSPKNSIQTQTSLIKRIGIMEHLLNKEGVQIQLYNLQSVRNKYFKGKDKKIQCKTFFNTHLNINLTDNHTDSLLALFWYLNLPLNEKNISEYNIKEFFN